MIDTTCKEYQDALIRRGEDVARIYSDRATKILLATAAHESHCGVYFFQLNGGPARGLFGMETETEVSIWQNFFKYSQKWRLAMTEVCHVISPVPCGNALTYNLKYQICLARIYYRLVPEPLPNPYNTVDQCEYWAKYWKKSDVSAEDKADFIKDYVRYLSDGAV
jgi:hypothetical protein